MSKPHTTHFGYRQVEPDEKAGLVRNVFDSVANRYDLMNDLMSLGIHRLWKRFAIELAGIRPGQRVLDLASGTGDLVLHYVDLVGPNGLVVMSDINLNMLNLGRDRLLDRGSPATLSYAQIDAEQLPFADHSFDRVSIAFGLRNVTHKERALAEMERVLRPGGRALVLEFSHPKDPLLQKGYDAYSFGLLPLIGRLVTGDGDSYRYLAESIRMHPDQETLQAMMQEAGFDRVDIHNLSGGIVALHRGFKA